MYRIYDTEVKRYIFNNLIHIIMECEMKVKDHATDRCIDRGISDEELNEGLSRGARRKIIRLSRNKRKEFIRYRYYEIVCICVPCQRNIVTIYY